MSERSAAIWRDFGAAAAEPLARFEADLAAPRRCQETRLAALLAANADTEFGQAHGFDSITSYEIYRQRVRG